MKFRRLMAVMMKELRQMRRDRITLAMIVGSPVMQLLLFGYAINTNLRDLSAGIADQSRTSASRALAPTSDHLAVMFRAAASLAGLMLRRLE